jgi:hypothetical protein
MEGIQPRQGNVMERRFSDIRVYQNISINENPVTGRHHRTTPPAVEKDSPAKGRNDQQET